MGLLEWLFGSKKWLHYSRMLISGPDGVRIILMCDPLLSHNGELLDSITRKRRDGKLYTHVRKDVTCRKCTSYFPPDIR